ncbi:MAG: glycoside hydrolase family 9 protein, partial [Endomicrobia bacterium]|nr:glycoside hydrolase family 9 protein [Endomicrobiia bacterium]
MKNKNYILFFLFLFGVSYSQKIIINQIGYSLYEEKIAYFCADKETKDLNFLVIDKDTNKEVLKSSMSFYGLYYDKYFYIIDFSSLKEGKYILKTNNLQVFFSVNKDIYRRFYLDTIKSYFYIQRCAEEVPGWHRVCHLDDGVVPSVDKKLVDSLILNQTPCYPPSTHIDVSGGWHDAGDYNKYMGNLAVVVGILGIAFEEFDLIEDTDNDKIPDLLEELEYAIKWMLKMQDKDGGVFERVFSGYEYKGPPEKETDNKPKTSDDRYLDIDKYTDITAKFVAACAISYRVFRNYKEKFAQEILQAALKGWDWIKKNPNKYDTIPWSYGRYPGDKSAVVWAAVEMYQTTKSFEFLDFAERRVLEIKAVEGSLNHTSWLFQSVVGLSKIYLFTNHDRIKKVVLRELNRYLKKYIEVAVENPFYLRTGFIDAWEWGTNAIVLGSGFDLYWISKVFNDRSILNLALKARQWVLGLNYIGKSFVVGVGNSIENPYSLLAQSISKGKRIIGAVVPGLYILQGVPFYTEQQGSFKCNEATIDAAALYVFNVGIPEPEICFNLISPLRNSTIKGKQKLETEVLTNYEIDKVEYKIDDEEFKPLVFKNNRYFTEIDTSHFSDGEHIIYIRALKNNKILGGTLFKVNIDNVKEHLKILILKPQPYVSYIGGCEIICKLNTQEVSSYELYYSLDNAKTWNKLLLKDKKFYGEIIPNKTGEIDLIVKAVNLKTSEELKTENIKIFISKSGRIHTEENFRIVNDKSQTPIGPEKRRYDDSGCVVLPDEEDEIAIDFFVCEEGNYILRHRERSGDV